MDPRDRTSENVTAAEVIASELAAIRLRRRSVYPTIGGAGEGAVLDPTKDADARKIEARLETLEAHTVGLAFSGGGIRSGTFAVGFLQGLAQLGMLRRIDYLSTVSGGGYAGGWLAAWLKREGDPENVEKQLNPGRVSQSKASRALLDPGQVVDEEPEPVFHLRQYSSYLFPRFGFLTADTWTVIAIWMRNVAINLTMLLPLAMMIVLLARIVVYLYGYVGPAAIDGDRVALQFGGGLFVVGLAILYLASRYNAEALGEFRMVGEVGGFRTAEPWNRKASIETGVYRVFLLRLILAVVCITLGLRGFLWWAGAWVSRVLGGERRSGFPPLDGLSARFSWLWDYISGNLGYLGLPNLVLHATLFGIVMFVVALKCNIENKTLRSYPGRRPWKQPWFVFLSSALVAGAIGGILVPLLERLLQVLNDGRYSSLAATIVPPLALQIFVVAYMAEVALLGREVTEAEREWWARLSALLLIGALSWLLAMATILYVPALFLAAPIWIRIAIASGWLGSTALGVLAGRRVGPTPGGGGGGGGSVSLGMIAAVAPPIFLAGLLGVVSLLVAYLVQDNPPLAFPGRGARVGAVGVYFEGVEGTSVWTLLGWLIFTYVLFSIGSNRVDVNLFSLNAMYANRLTRCYLGASRPKPRWVDRWGRGHDPAAGGGASSSSPLAWTAREPASIAEEIVGLDPRALAARAADLQAARKDLKHRRDESTREQERLVDEVRDRPALAGGSGENPLEAIRRERAAIFGELWEVDWRLLEVLDLQLARLGLGGGGARRRLASERHRVRAELAYLMAGQSARDENPVTGFDPGDDIPLWDLQIDADRHETGKRYRGPLPLINTSLNMVAGRELAWRDRKAESFVLTPYFCGSKSVGYARLTAATRENLTLGRAITISGAAVDPNMSFYQSSALTAFLTIFNARLGYWMRNPKFPDWKADSPVFGDRLLGELLGRTDSKGEFVHLSDGGHFDNLGLYELIRRRCRYIVAVDAGEDADASDDNLAILTRLCRIDFGVRVELDSLPLRAEGPDRLSRTHVVVGRIHYEDVDNGQVPGILVYVKISMTGDEPSDVEKYARKDPRFPHQPTDLRQSFGEEQFESYRALGDHIARDVFGDAVGQVREAEYRKDVWAKPEGEVGYIRGNQFFFSALRGRWATPPMDHDARYVEAARQWTQFQRDIRDDPELEELSRDLYPELVPGTEPVSPPRPTPRRRSHELHAVGQMLQIMEDSWLSLGLKGHHDLPMDRGWMNVFRRWAGSRAFHRYWPALRPEFSPEFVKFCEDQLHLGHVAEPAYLLPGGSAFDSFEGISLRRLGEEFRREWPPRAGAVGDADPRSRDLEEMVRRARELEIPIGEGGEAPIWLIVQSPSGGASARDFDERFACGVVLVCACEDIEALRQRDPARFERDAKSYELFAWIRRPNRSTGLGSRSYESIRDDIARWLVGASGGRPVQVVTRYPKADLEGERDLELSMWKNFFSLYDFRPVRTPEGAAETILIRTIKPAPASRTIATPDPRPSPEATP